MGLAWQVTAVIAEVVVMVKAGLDTVHSAVKEAAMAPGACRHRRRSTGLWGFGRPTRTADRHRMAPSRLRTTHTAARQIDPPSGS